MSWLTQYWPVMVVAAGLIATWAKMTSKMSEWDKVIPMLATKADVQSSIDLSLKTLQLDLLKAEAAKKDAEMDRLRKSAGRLDDA